MVDSDVSSWTQCDSSVASTSVASTSLASTKDKGAGWMSEDRMSKISEEQETCIEDLEADENESINVRREQKCPRQLIQSIALGMFSTLLLTLFLLAAVAQSDKGISWVLFYILNAAVPAIFLIHWVCCFPAMALHVLAMINAVWSIIFLVTAALKIRDTGTSSADDIHNIFKVVRRTENSQNFIIAMASIGFFSSMYHSLMAEHCIDSKKKKEVNDDGSVEIYSDDEE